MRINHNYLKYYQPNMGDCIVDVGATYGEFAIVHKDLFTKQEVRLFNVEPSPFSFIKLATNMKEVTFPVVNLNFGVCKDSRPVLFLQTDNQWCNGCAEWEQKSLRSRATILYEFYIATYSLRKLMDITGYIHFLKMDINGAEVSLFDDDDLYPLVENMAIETNHKIKDEYTYVHLMEKLKTNYELILEKESYDGFPAEEVLYAKRK